jgi:hypothetical protein
MTSHRWVQCCNRNCYNIEPADQMVEVATVVKGRKRGLVCAPCAVRLREMLGGGKERSNG